jgi:hypothetical protein
MVGGQTTRIRSQNKEIRAAGDFVEELTKISVSYLQ